MKRIKDLRTRRLGTHGIQQEASVEDAVREFLTTDVSALVVYDGKKLAGIFTKNDLVRCVGDHPDGIRGINARDYMQTNVFTATVDADLDNVMEVMVEKGFRHVPVLEGDEVVGMVTSIDILVHQKSHLGSERDELVRYIQGS
ncbi:MAG: CBS domain-containing protein [Deltaproteobacteria bacterium]|nr:CBS domain-containing protein [Deltaproteobacteria bacterium]